MCMSNYMCIILCVCVCMRVWEMRDPTAFVYVIYYLHINIYITYFFLYAYTLFGVKKSSYVPFCTFWRLVKVINHRYPLLEHYILYMYYYYYWFSTIEVSIVIAHHKASYVPEGRCTAKKHFSTQIYEIYKLFNLWFLIINLKHFSYSGGFKTSRLDKNSVIFHICKTNTFVFVMRT